MLKSNKLLFGLMVYALCVTGLLLLSQYQFTQLSNAHDTVVTAVADQKMVLQKNQEALESKNNEVFYLYERLNFFEHEFKATQQQDNYETLKIFLANFQLNQHITSDKKVSCLPYFGAITAPIEVLQPKTTLECGLTSFCPVNYFNEPTKRNSCDQQLGSFITQIKLKTPIYIFLLKRPLNSSEIKGGITAQTQRSKKPYVIQELDEKIVIYFNAFSKDDPRNSSGFSYALEISFYSQSDLSAPELIEFYESIIENSSEIKVNIQADEVYIF